MLDKVLILRACRRLALVPLLAGCASSGTAVPATVSLASPPEIPVPTEAPVAAPAPRLAPAEARTVLADLPAEGSGRLRYDVSFGRCSEATSCPLEVRLLRDGNSLDAVELARVDTSRGVGPEAVEPFWGAGDPLLGEPTRTAQRFGYEGSEVSVLAREVALSGTERALLVTQQFGFEHVHRRNDLFVVSGGRLARAWSAEEGSGPSWTTVAIVPRPGGTEALVFFKGFLQPDPDEPDTLSARALTWDVQQRTMVEQAQVSAAAPVYAAVVGRFANARAAQKVKEGKYKCLAQSFSALRRDEIPGAGRGGYALAAMSTRRDLAEKALADGKRCLSTPVGALLELP